MKETDGLHEFIEKLEDLTTIKVLLVQADYNLKNGGGLPLVPVLNDAGMTDTLSSVLEAAFNKDKNKSTSE